MFKKPSSLFRFRFTVKSCTLLELNLKKKTRFGVGDNNFVNHNEFEINVWIYDEVDWDRIAFANWGHGEIIFGKIVEHSWS